jgi:hypothetical protein
VRNRLTAKELVSRNLQSAETDVTWNKCTRNRRDGKLIKMTITSFTLCCKPITAVVFQTEMQVR